MVAVASGAATLANTLFTSLTSDVTFEVPDVSVDAGVFAQPATTGPLFATITPVTIDALTTGVDGTGAFDRLMTSLTAYLKIEYEANRISGAEYTKAYAGIIESALQASQQFVLAKDQAYWSSLLVQAQARTADIETVKARLEMEIARVKMASTQFEAATIEVNYALTKLKLATEDITYSNLAKQGLILDTTQDNLVIQGQIDVITKANLVKQGENIDLTNDQLTQQTANLVKEGSNLVKQGDQLVAQTANTVKQTSYLTSQIDGLEYTNANILPEQKKLAMYQVDSQRAQTHDILSAGDPVNGVMGRQNEILEQQKVLIAEQAEVQRAQTRDARSDSESVNGVLGKQKELYNQQIDSYKRDAETKFAKIYSDAWITQKTIDEGLTAPAQFTNENVNEVLTKLRVKLDLNDSA